jgi:hypothetical protein
VTESLRILMTRLIDYAGLFPPAGLSMKTSVRNFDAYRRLEQAWMLNRFVIPVSRFEEFLRALEQIDQEQTDKVSEIAVPWKISAIVGPDAESDIAAIMDFNRHTSACRKPVLVESLELKVTDAAAICRLTKLIPGNFETYFEIPCTKTTEDYIKAIARVGLYAKLRTGGDNAGMFPSYEDLAHFLVTCAFNSTPFKLSAGLHHAVRSVHRYTYEPSSPLGPMHGFLNVFVGAAFARQGMNAREVESILTEESGESFGFEQTEVRWRGCRISNRELASARNSFCFSFGSCSFQEPIDDLRALGLL